MVFFEESSSYMYSSFQASTESGSGSGNQMDALLSYIATVLEDNTHSDASRLQALIQSRNCSKGDTQTCPPWALERNSFL